MRSLLALACLAVAAVAVAPAPQFTVNLDAPPEHRWDGAVALLLSKHSWNESFGPTLAYYDASVFAAVPAAVLAELAGLVRQRMPDRYGELQGLARQFAAAGHPELDAPRLAVWNYFYELAHVQSFPNASAAPAANNQTKHSAGGGRFATVPGVDPAMLGCTGLLALPEEASAPVYHGRNLDLMPLELRNLTLQVAFVRNGSATPVYEGLGWLWFCATFLTSYRRGYVTISGDWRNELLPFETVMGRIRASGVVPMPQLFRTFHERKMSFDEIVNYTANTLSGSVASAPAYLIMSGPGRQAAVVTVSVEAKPMNLTLHRLNDATVAAGGEWFIMQTNYDWWNPPPPTDPRRLVGQDTLRALGRRRGATRMGVWMTISEFPVHNAATAYSAVMSVDEPHLDGYTRLAMSPLTPWYPPHQ